MAESYGWAGKILRVNLTTGEITTQDDAKYHKYIGGMGMAYRIMYEEAPMELDPYDEKALVIFGVGPLTGAGVPCSGRMNVTFRSTWSKGHSIIDAHMGGHIGSMLKYAGYDGIVVSGISEKPVYLRIEDGNVSLEDASEIWGKGTFAANKWMVEQNGREFETASIGPAGENLVDYSTLNTSFGNSGGAGLGGVLTPVGVDTLIEESPFCMGKETIDGKQYLKMKPIHADFALLGTYKCDEFGNCWYKGTMRNFNVVMATAADTVIAECEYIVPVGDIEPENVHTYGMCVNYIVEGDRK